MLYDLTEKKMKLRKENENKLIENYIHRTKVKSHIERYTEIETKTVNL